ncbi:MAG TPA: cupin domain-containing protein [Burkholderiaceae bacterium]|nr:cupin domain-containing protein [Burkholderiaceae bacterium]
MGVSARRAAPFGVPAFWFDIEVKNLYSQKTLQQESAMTETRSQVEPELIRLGALEIRYLQAAGNGCEMGFFEMRVPPACHVPPPHSHRANEELVYVLEGTLRYTVGSQTRDLRPGDFMATPRGAVHAFSNPHAVDARALVINTPDIGPKYFREVAAVVNAGGPPDRAKLMGIMQAFGLVPAAPPEAQAH